MPATVPTDPACPAVAALTRPGRDATTTRWRVGVGLRHLAEHLLPDTGGPCRAGAQPGLAALATLLGAPRPDRVGPALAARAAASAAACAELPATVAPAVAGLILTGSLAGVPPQPQEGPDLAYDLGVEALGPTGRRLLATALQRGALTPGPAAPAAEVTLAVELRAARGWLRRSPLGPAAVIAALAAGAGHVAVVAAPAAAGPLGPVGPWLRLLAHTDAATAAVWAALGPGPEPVSLTPVDRHDRCAAMLRLWGSGPALARPEPAWDLAGRVAAAPGG